MPDNSVIGFFSSDSRPLYIDDILKVISYPEGYVLPFRYRKEHIASCYQNNLQSLIGQKSVIIFTTGNTLGAANVSLTHNPVRLAEIIDIDDDEQTDRIYFYLKLLDFCKASEQIPDDNQRLFVRNINQRIEASTFVEVVTRIDVEKYPSLFTIIGCYGTGKKQDKRYDRLIYPITIDKKDSLFCLDDEAEYKMDIAFYSKNGTAKHEFSVNNDLILLNKDYDGIVGTIADKQSYYFHTASISSEKSVSAISVKLTDGNSGYMIPLTFSLQRNSNKPFLFALFSIFSLVGITLASKAVDFFKSSTIGGIACIVASIGLVGFSAASLYKFFNKK